MGTLACQTERGSGSLGTAQGARPGPVKRPSQALLDGRAVAPASYRASEYPRSAPADTDLTDCDGCSFAVDAVTGTAIPVAPASSSELSIATRPVRLGSERKEACVTIWDMADNRTFRMRLAISIPQLVGDGRFDPAAFRGSMARAESLGFKTA
jgi:hypothetical protein